MVSGFWCSIATQWVRIILPDPEIIHLLFVTEKALWLWHLQEQGPPVWKPPTLVHTPLQLLSYLKESAFKWCTSLITDSNFCPLIKCNSNTLITSKINFKRCSFFIRFIFIQHNFQFPYHIIISYWPFRFWKLKFLFVTHFLVNKIIIP